MDDEPSLGEKRVQNEELRWILDAKVRALGFLVGKDNFTTETKQIAQQIADLEIP